MDIEEAFKQIGDIGVFQRRVFWSTAIPQIFVAWIHLLNIFAAAIPDFYCHLEKPTYDNKTKLLNKCSPDSVNNPCVRYSFSDLEFTSIASEWDLVCESAFKCDLVQSVFMVGLIIGNLLGGYMADKYGRKHTCCIGSFGFLIFGLLSTFSTSYEQYLSFRLINGIASGTYGLISYTYPAEMVGASYRGYVNFVTSVTFALGISSLPILAYFVRDWRVLSLYTALPGLVGIYYYYCTVESPRWLWSVNKVEEAEHIINLMHTANNPLSLPAPPPLSLSSSSLKSLPGLRASLSSLKSVSLYWCMYAYKYVYVSVFSVPSSLPPPPPATLTPSPTPKLSSSLSSDNIRRHHHHHHHHRHSGYEEDIASNDKLIGNAGDSYSVVGASNSFGGVASNSFGGAGNSFGGAGNSYSDEEEEMNRLEIVPMFKEAPLYHDNTTIAGLFDGILHTYEEIQNTTNNTKSTSGRNTTNNNNNNNNSENANVNNNNYELYSHSYDADDVAKGGSYRIRLRHNKSYSNVMHGKSSSSSLKWRDVVSNKHLVKITLVNMITWFTANTLYYGLTLKMGDLNGNRYVNVMLAGLVEIPACLMTLYFMDKYGRRSTFTYSLLLGGLLTFFIGLTNPGTSYVSVAFALISKTTVAMGVCVCWMHATEMYPTNIRNKAMSLCSMCGRLGGVCAPMILSLGRANEGRDFLIFGLSSLISAFFSSELPETLNRKLPETIEDLIYVSV